jgi:hypothetical protein
MLSPMDRMHVSPNVISMYPYIGVNIVDEVGIGATEVRLARSLV